MVKIECPLRPKLADLADHFMAENSGHGRVAAAVIGVEIAAADGGAEDADENLAACQHREIKAFEGERPVGSMEHGGARGTAVRRHFVNHFLTGRMITAPARQAPAMM